MEHTHIASAALYEYVVPFRQPFITAGRTFAERRGLILRLTSSEGLVGLGEIAPLPGFSLETLAEARVATISQLRRLSGAAIPTDRNGLATIMTMSAATGELPASVAFGIEGALIDLAAQLAGLPAARWLNRESDSTVTVNAVLTGADTEITTTAAAKYAAGFRTFKIKVGGRSIADDLARIEAVCSAIGADAAIRLDANRAWPFDEALTWLQQASLRFEYVEEPLAAPSWPVFDRLRGLANIPIALDESLPVWLREHPADDPHRYFDVAIVKPPVIGGIVYCLDLIKRWRKQGIKCVVTSALDTAIGISASLHLALAARISPVACGFDTLELLADPLAQHELKFRGSILSSNATHGFGLKLNDSAPSFLQQMAYED